MLKNIIPAHDCYLPTPGQYIDRPGVLADCGELVAVLGERVILSGGPRALASLPEELAATLAQHGVQLQKSVFGGECCAREISRIVQAAKEFSAEVVIAAGGGKSIDTGKAAAQELGIPVVCIPTIAATCACSSSLCIVYDDAGESVGDIALYQAPDLVLADPKVIAFAPAEYLQSGILDSMAKWYEGRLAIKKIARPDAMTLSAVHLSKLLVDEMKLEAVAAVQDGREHRITASLVKIMDFNLYIACIIQGLGKDTRGAVGHSINSGFSVLRESHVQLHGNKVAYGLLIQLLLEGESEEEYQRTERFFIQLGLSPSFSGMGLPYTPDTVRRVAVKTLEHQNMENVPFAVTAEQIEAAIVRQEELFRQPVLAVGRVAN